ncbi:MAG TPA: protein kinase [Pyrinomonadaceae bacterium]|nr:protein kinase [Pyrinomonadaceae bacterium]
MGLAAGTKFGRYEVRSQLGAGGMGEVYLARDSGLDRLVALKILPEKVASNAERMQRFVQEAKTASALNHPNILTIHEIGTEPGAHFIVTEFIEGETLRRRMVHRPPTLVEAVDIALQLASALSTAHAAGIIHRDIKPENIMMRQDGIVKVLDFGLAKLTERWRAEEVDPDAATKAWVQTEPGVVMGTTAYMSPEQTRALDVDPRTDIWSLGVVLYEMVTGKAPFKSDTASDTSAAILKSEPPPLSEWVPEIPFELERIVRKALQKDREERYQVVKDLQLDLKSLKRDLETGASVERSGASYGAAQLSSRSAERTNPSGVSTQASMLTQQESGAKRTRGWLPALLLIPLVVFGIWYWWGRPKESDGIRTSSLTVTQLTSGKKELGETGTNHARFSPDGKFVAYSSTKDGTSGIWLKQVGGGEPFRNRSEQDLVESPIWSPDGQQIAYLSKRGTQKGIWTMPAFGGSPTLIAALDRFSRELIAWSRDGQIYFVALGNLYALDIASRQVSELTKFDQSKPFDRSFSISPDNQRVAYTDFTDEQIDIWTMPTKGGQPARVTNDEPVDSNLVWTPDGKSILYSSQRSGVQQIFVAYPDGRKPVQLTVNDSDSEVMDVSSDGARILYVTSRNESDLWSVPLDRLKENQLTSDIGIELWPTVAPDGKAFAFQATQSSKGATIFNGSLVAKSLIGEGTLLQLAPDGFAPRWSPDGKQIAFLRHTSGPPNLWRVNAAGGDASALTTGGITFGGFTMLPYNRSQTQDFQWSSDSSRLLYCANSSGVDNVWQMAVDGSGAKQVSHNATSNVHFFDPMWSPDGQRVAWLSLVTPGSAQEKMAWTIWLSSDGKDQALLESRSVLGLVGWSPSGQELIVKSIAGSGIAPAVPADVSLFAIGINGGPQRPLAELKASYFQNIQIGPLRNQIAFVTRADGADSLQVIPAIGGVPRTITSSSDPRVYFSGLAWSADGKALFYGKQASWTVLSMIDNFK